MQPNTIDERVLNLNPLAGAVGPYDSLPPDLHSFAVRENLTLLISSMRSTGMAVVGVKTDDILAGTPSKVLEVAGQLLRAIQKGARAVPPTERHRLMEKEVENILQAVGSEVGATGIAESAAEVVKMFVVGSVACDTARE